MIFKSAVIGIYELGNRLIEEFFLTSGELIEPEDISLNQSQPSESNFISLSAFIQSLKKQKVAENSIESYISDLKGFLQSQDISVDSIEPAAIIRIQQQHIESYLQHLIGKSVKYATDLPPKK